MDVNAVLLRLMTEFNSLPAIKLAWNCQLHFNDETDDIPKISPSHYLRELNYTSEERHGLLAEQHKNLKCSRNGFKIFVEPSVVAFQNYENGDKLSATVSIRNMDKQMQRVSFFMDENGPFRIDQNSRHSVKFAPGMVTSILIHFRPEDDGDYFHKFVVRISGAQFSIPVVGIGARAFLNFPDRIIFGKVPVRNSNKHVISVLNTGSKPARVLLSMTGQFEVTPEKAVVMPNKTLNVVLTFDSASIGKEDGFLRIKYDNGEEVHIYVEAESVNQDISFESTDIEFENTYVGMMSKMKLTIRNNSKMSTKFQWRKTISASSFLGLNAPMALHPMDGKRESKEEAKFKKRQSSRGDSVAINEIIQLHKECGYSERREPLYADEIFRIEPSAGEILPNTIMELLVMFSPMRTGMCFSEAYCEINGLEERAELRLIGQAIGPKFRFGFDTLDVGNVCIGGGHTYELPITNTSQVEGTISYVDLVGLLDDRFTVKPHQITLSPGEYSAFYLYFDAVGKPGNIFEEINFKIQETGEILSIIIKGETAGATVRFDSDLLNFGEVSYAYTTSRHALVINESMIPLDVCVAVEPDGTEKVLTPGEIIEALKQENFKFDGNGKEFAVEPSRFLLSPRGLQRITVTISPAMFGIYNPNICVRMAEYDSGILKQLPILADCVVPTFIRPEGPITVKCLRGLPCPGIFTFHNPSALSAVYCIIPQGSDNVVFSSLEFLDVTLARTSTTVHFEATAKILGELEGVVEFYVAGKLEPIFDIPILCIATSPISSLKLNTKLIDLGECTLRVKKDAFVGIINSSNVPIPFTISLFKGGAMKELWEANPQTGIAKPNSETQIEISAILFEMGSYEAAFRISAPGSPDESLKLWCSATGIGCPFVFEPELPESGVIDMGYVFINTPKTITYQVKNAGLLRKNLEWKHGEEEPPINPNIYEGKKSKKATDHKKQIPVKIGKTSSLFDVQPMKKALKENESFVLTIKAYSTTPRLADATFTLWTYADVPKEVDRNLQKRISKANNAHQVSKDRKELNVKDKVYVPTAVQTIKLIAQFATPRLIFSQHVLDFRLDPNPTDASKNFQQKKSLHIQNPCDAPLAVIMDTNKPFGMIVDGEVLQSWKHTFQGNEEFTLKVNFEVTLQGIKESELVNFSEKLECVYEKHPSSDEAILLRAELYFPTVLIDVEVIDFGEVTNAKEAVINFNTMNPGKFCITYKMYIVAESVKLNVINPRDEACDTWRELDFLYTPSEANVFTEYEAFPEDALEPILPTGMEPNEVSRSNSMEEKIMKAQEMPEANRSCDDRKKDEKFCYEKLLRTNLMGALGLRDPSVEPNDELTYFQHFQEEPPTYNGYMTTPNEIIDIIPTSGIIQAGGCQKFSAVFFAHSDIEFEMKIGFSVENGVSKFILVKGKSVRAENPLAYLYGEGC